MTDAETYHGKPCAKGGHTLRWRSNRKCVACHTLPVKYFATLDGERPRQVGEDEALRSRSSRYVYWRAHPVDNR
jgi:hypothetical protein